MIPYGRQHVDEDDIQAVVEVLRSDFLTTGPVVEAFEAALTDYCGATHGIAVSNGTSALIMAVQALDIGPGDEVLLPAMTFAATATAVVMAGATPVFVDVLPDVLLIDPRDVERKISARTKAIIAVDYAGNTCDYDALQALCRAHGLSLIADACHALGALYKGRRTGTLADMTIFSFHPVKHITTGEGGFITTNDNTLAKRLRRLRNHGIDTDARNRERNATWKYSITELSGNNRITDIQCALGLSQLKKLDGFLARRRELSQVYARAFALSKRISPVPQAAGSLHAYHLYVVLLDLPSGLTREALFHQMRDAGIGVNVHYIPVHHHPFYQRTFGLGPGLLPHTEAAYERMLTLPIFPDMTNENANTIAATLRGLLGE